MIEIMWLVTIVILICGALAYASGMYLREWIVFTVVALFVMFVALSFGSM